MGYEISFNSSLVPPKDRLLISSISVLRFCSFFKVDVFFWPCFARLCGGWMKLDPRILTGKSDLIRFSVSEIWRQRYSYGLYGQSLEILCKWVPVLYKIEYTGLRVSEFVHKSVLQNQYECMNLCTKPISMYKSVYILFAILTAITQTK